MSTSFADDPDIPDIELGYELSHSQTPSPTRSPTISRQLPAVRYHMCVSGHVAKLDSPGMQKARAQYNVEMSHSYSHSSNYSQEYNDKIGIVMVRTSKADDYYICGCINIHGGLVLMAMYHFIISIVYTIGFGVEFNDYEMNTFSNVICVLFAMTVGLRWFYPISFFVLMPRYRSQSALEFISNSGIRKILKMWRVLLLVTPIAMVLVFILGMEMVRPYDTGIDFQEIEVCLVFIAIMFDLTFSLYLFSAAFNFASTKWPNLWQ